MSFTLTFPASMAAASARVRPSLTAAAESRIVFAAAAVALAASASVVLYALETAFG